MKTLKDLGFRKFNYDKEGNIKNSTSASCSVSSTISIDEFMSSLVSNPNSKAVPISGHQAIEEMQKLIDIYVPDNKRTHTPVYVYRDHVNFPNYIEDISKSRLTTVKQLDESIPVNDMMFGRFITKIPIIGNNDYQASLAIKWENKEIQIGCGLNVKVCDNYNILTSDLLTTSVKIPYYKMIEQVEEYLKDVQGNFRRDVEAVDRMKNKVIQKKHVSFMLGEMMQRYHRNQKVISLSEISGISSQIISKECEGVPTENLWDFTNRGTEIIRFDRTSGESVLENIKNFNTFVTSFS